MLKEFDIIYNHFHKLVSKKESLNLQDDCAIITSNKQIVINVDTIVEEEHFFSEDPAKSIAHKLIAVNLSDIASMGAIPKYWSLAITIPKNRLVNLLWIENFCAKIAELQDQYQFFLIAGDTTFTEGKLTLSANFFAEVAKNKIPLQKTKATPGDLLCIAGYIGDSFWGLELLKHQYNKGGQSFKFLAQKDKNYLIEKYQYPDIYTNLGITLLDFANSATDISDGFWSDMEKLCKFSSVVGRIDLSEMIFSPVVNKIINKYGDKAILQSICAGDDYVLAFSITKEKLAELKKILDKKYFIQEIGVVISAALNTDEFLEVYHNNHKITNIKIKGYNY